MSSPKMELLFLIALLICTLGSFVAAAAFGSVRKANLPRYRRLRGAFMGVGLGGIASSFLLLVTSESVVEWSYAFGGFLAKHGFPSSVFTWSVLYFVSGGVFGGMAAGGGIGWWLSGRRQPVKLVYKVSAR